nr:outer membrane protein assembly factor BamB [Legionella yabuuchiae]
MKKSLMLLSMVLILPGCSKVDDYMLGKDNTPKPETLEPIKSKVTLKEKWSASIGTGSKSSMYLKLKPVIQDHIVYTADNSGLIQAIDKTTSKPLWVTQLKEKIISGPAIGQGYLVVGTNTANVVLLDQTNGKQIWKTEVSGDALAKPVIAHNKVLVKTVDGHLYGLDLHKGSKDWIVDHGAPNLVLKASSTPVVLDKLALVGYSDGKLDAVDLQTGALLWQRGIAYASGSSDVERLVDIDADPIVRGSVAYLATYQGYVGAFSLVDGQFIWRKPASTYKNIALDEQALYLADSDDVIWAFDLKNGNVRWKQPALKARSLTEPVLMGNRLFIGDKTGLLHVLSTQNGEFVSRKQLNGPIYTGPIVSDHNLYVMTGNGLLNQLAVS